MRTELSLEQSQSCQLKVASRRKN